MKYLGADILDRVAPGLIADRALTISPTCIYCSPWNTAPSPRPRAALSLHPRSRLPGLDRGMGTRVTDE